MTDSPRILFIEDDLELTAIYKARLEDQGITVLHCKDGQEGLEKIKDFNPDLVILDLMMPRLSGFDFIDLVRHLPGTFNPKIIVLTAMSTAESKQRAITLGADEYLVKSEVVLDDVIKIVRRYLGLPESPNG